MPEAKSITRNKLLVVEGKDAARFFTALLRHMEIDSIQIQDFGGKDEIHRFIKALKRTPGFNDVTALGIVRDADDDPTAAFQSVCSALQNAQLPVPPAPEQPATDHPQTKILILPDASSHGMLETACMNAVADDPVMPCIEDYFVCVERTSGLPKNMDKARLHAFLASRSEPKFQLGIAADAGYWPWDSPAFEHIQAFLRSL